MAPKRKEGEIREPDVQGSSNWQYIKLISPSNAQSQRRAPAPVPDNPAARKRPAVGAQEIVRGQAEPSRLKRAKFVESEVVEGELDAGDANRRTEEEERHESAEVPAVVKPPIPNCHCGRPARMLIAAPLFGSRPYANCARDANPCMYFAWLDAESRAVPSRYHLDSEEDWRDDGDGDDSGRVSRDLGTTPTWTLPRHTQQHRPRRLLSPRS
ncbi:hypothetical protein DFH07DRAFT_357983 [Mycena maculata]|uniref:Uncharacterized protein n=1 Tax=Mycena maculata TaxID=230809 RepID=A0AAD7JLI6_9AGAR|nr:hypothetical protein DFH07DRAFT_357983 [Mycena maculata]